MKENKGEKQIVLPMLLVHILSNLKRLWRCYPITSYKKECKSIEACTSVRSAILLWIMYVCMSCSFDDSRGYKGSENVNYVLSAFAFAIFSQEKS